MLQKHCNIFHGCPKFHIINLARWPTFNQVRTDIRPLCIQTRGLRNQWLETQCCMKESCAYQYRGVGAAQSCPEPEPECYVQSERRLCIRAGPEPPRAFLVLVGAGANSGRGLRYHWLGLECSVQLKESFLNQYCGAELFKIFVTGSNYGSS